MKLRLRDDTIRLRLTRSEVEALAEHGRLEAETRLAGARLVYAVEAAETTTAPEARLTLASHRAELVVCLSRDRVRAWAAGDEVGLYGTQEIPETGDALSLSVEKDFRCLQPRDEAEDPPDAFPHPREGSEAC